MPCAKHVDAAGRNRDAGIGIGAERGTPLSVFFKVVCTDSFGSERTVAPEAGYGAVEGIRPAVRESQPRDFLRKEKSR